MATLQEERKELETKLNAIVPPIVAAMGKDWKLNKVGGEYRTDYYLLGPGEQRLEISKQQYPKVDRLVISGRWPKSPDNAWTDPKQYMNYDERQKYAGCEITVALNRAPEVIAREIERRLLPEYSRVLALVQEGIQKHVNYTRTKDATLARVAAAFGVKLSDWNKQQYKFTASEADVEVEIYGETDCTVKLRNLTVEQAEQLAVLLLKTKGVK